MLIPVVLALLTAATPPQDSARGVIRGTVYSEPAGLPVSLAVVEADNGRQTVHAVSDSTGAYRLRVSAGRQTLRIRHLEHAPHEVEVVVPPGGEVPVDVALEHRPIALAPLQVRPPGGARDDSVAAARPDVGVVIDHRTAEDGGGLGGALDPIGISPGEKAGSAGEALYVRGASANLQLVLLDGAPVYAPFHMGGLIETFQPDVVGAARLYLGGAPARYDGGLSYVMDLSTRSGRDQPAAAGMLDVVSAGARVEGPLGGARYLGSVRTVHGASLGTLQGTPFPYDFADGLLRMDLPVRGGAVSATVFANIEGVLADTLASGEGADARWGNLAGSLRYRGRFEGSDVEVTLAAGRFDADLPKRDTVGRLFLLDGRSERVRAGVDFTRATGPVLLRYGAVLEQAWVEHRARQPEVYHGLLHVRVSGLSTGAYVDGTWQPAARLVLRGGLRGDAYSVGDVATLAPRASATWLLAEGAALTLAGGRYHQYVRIPRPLASGAVPANYVDSARLATNITVAGATHLSLGLDQQMTGGVRLGLEGYYKRYQGLPMPGRGDSLFTAHNSGMDVWVRRTAGPLTGWFGYSLNWTWGPEDETGTSDRFAGRQTVSAGVQGVAWKRSVLAVRLAYGAPLSGSLLTASERVLDNAAALPTRGQSDAVETDAPLRGPGSKPFLRVDAELSRTWSPRLAGRRTQVTPYLRVINALDDRDGLFFRYFSDGAGGRGEDLHPVATLPVVPVFGISWKL